MKNYKKGVPRTIRLDGAIEKEIKDLLPSSGMENFSHFARHLFRLGVTEERKRQTVFLHQNQQPAPAEARA